MKNTGRFLLIVLLNLFTAGLFGYEINDTQQVPAGHWVYEAMYTLNADAKIVNPIETAPMSIGELKFYFNQINYDDLSEFSKDLYEDVKKFLYEPRTFYNKDDLVLNFNVGVNPEFYYKTGTSNDINNPEYIDWTFDYYYKDNLLSLPFYIGFSNYFSIEMDMFIGKNYG